MAALFSGCTSTRYNWSGYEDALYSQYKDPANQVSDMEELQEIVEASAKKPEIRMNTKDVIAMGRTCLARAPSVGTM